jgi:hypothetical protein
MTAPELRAHGSAIGRPTGVGGLKHLAEGEKKPKRAISSQTCSNKIALLKRHPGCDAARSGAALIRDLAPSDDPLPTAPDPVSALRHFMPQCARDDGVGERR